MQKGLLALLGVLSVLAVTEPGTGDVGIWVGRLYHALDFGLVDGFAANNADYPPLKLAWFNAMAHVLLFAGADATAGHGWIANLAVVIALAVNYLLVVVIVAYWTRDIVTINAVMGISVLMLSLKYLDLMYAPPLLGALWALQQQRLALFSTLFAVAALTKWQPLIIAPFLAVYLLCDPELLRKSRLSRTAVLMRSTLPGLCLASAVITVFGWPAVWASLTQALHNRFLSGNALNLGWVISDVLRHLDAVTYLPVQGTMMDSLENPPAWSLWLLKAVFAFFFFTTLWRYAGEARQGGENAFENLLLYAALGYLFYCTFNSGVHENHLYLSAVLLVIAAWRQSAWRTLMVGVMAALNINLWLFYGASGRGPGIDRLLAGGFDSATLLSLLFVTLATGLWWRLCRPVTSGNF